MLADEGTDIDAVDQNVDGGETKIAETDDKAKVELHLQDNLCSDLQHNIWNIIMLILL